MRNKIQLAADAAIETLLRETLKVHAGNVSHTAEALGADRTSVHRYLRRFGLLEFARRLRGGG